MQGVVLAKGGLLVFAHHKSVVEALCNQLGKLGQAAPSGSAEHFEVRRIDGGTHADERDAARDSFQNPESSVRVVVISMTAGGMGLNLQAATTIVFAELPQTATLLQQCEGRAHRQGVHHPVLVYLVVAAAEKHERRLWLSLQRSDIRVGRILDGATAQARMNVDSIAPPSAIEMAAKKADDEVVIPAADDRDGSARAGKPKVSGWGRARKRSIDKRRAQTGRKVAATSTASEQGASADAVDTEQMPPPSPPPKRSKQLDAKAVQALSTDATHNSVADETKTEVRENDIQSKEKQLAAVDAPAVQFLVSPHTGMVHLLWPDGTRCTQAGGVALCFRWDELPEQSLERWGRLDSSTEMLEDGILSVRSKEDALHWIAVGPAALRARVATACYEVRIAVLQDV
jgi:hypothetical protein